MVNSIAVKIFVTMLSFAIVSFAIPKQALGIESNEEALRKKVGQLFIVGIPFQTVNTELTTYLSKYPFGNFILFKRNISDEEQTKQLIGNINTLTLNNTQLMPIISVDEEGGIVSRLPIYPKIPSPQSIANSKVPNSITTFAHETAKILSQSGINTNLAPVLDLSSPDKITFISSRGFSDNPNITADLGFEFSRQMILNRVLPTAKHFPGSINITEDPHKNSYSINRSLQELKEAELIPFAKYSTLGRFSAVMLSHYHYTAFDEKPTPASLSANAINYLRNELKFKGLVISDDLQMAGVKNILKPSEAVLESLKAGTDLVIMSYSQQDQIEAFERVLKAAKNGELSKQQLDEKLSRIKFVKQFFKLNNSQRNLASWQSDNLLSLDEQIVEQRIQGLTIDPKKSLCLINHKDGFTKQLRLELDKRKIEYKGIENSIPEDLKDCEQIIASIFNRKSAVQFLKIANLNKNKNLYGINIGSPALSENLDKNQIIELIFPHSTSAKKIAERISASAI